MAAWHYATCGAVLGVIASTSAYAGAWTQPRGESQLIATFSVTSASSRFDDADSDSAFTKLEMRVYGERGLTDWLTLAGQAAYARSDLSQGGVIQVGGGTDVEGGVRVRLFQRGPLVASVQSGAAYVSGFAGARDPITGAPGWDWETRLQAGSSLEPAISGGFIDLQGAYRRRFGDAADEWRFDLSAGATFRDPWRIFVQSFNTIGVGAARAPFERARGHKVAVTLVRPIGRQALGDRVHF